MPNFTSSSRIDCSVPTLRQFLGATANIPKIADPELEMKVLEAPEFITAGAEIELRVSAYGFKQRMKQRYTEVTETVIVAEQIEGPTRTWIHRQSVSVHEGGGSLLTDIIDFEPPGGMLGFVMTADKIIETLGEGMEFRYETLSDILGGR